MCVNIAEVQSLIKIIGLAWFSNLFVWRFDMEWFDKFKSKYLDYHIFQCSTCFGFWISLISHYNLNILDNLLTSLCVSVVASYMSKNLNTF